MSLFSTHKKARLAHAALFIGILAGPLAHADKGTSGENLGQRDFARAERDATVACKDILKGAEALALAQKVNEETLLNIFAVAGRNWIARDQLPNPRAMLDKAVVYFHYNNDDKIVAGQGTVFGFETVERPRSQDDRYQTYISTVLRRTRSYEEPPALMTKDQMGQAPIAHADGSTGYVIPRGYVELYERPPLSPEQKRELVAATLAKYPDHFYVDIAGIPIETIRGLTDNRRNISIVVRENQATVLGEIVSTAIRAQARNSVLNTLINGYVERIGTKVYAGRTVFGAARVEFKGFYEVRTFAGVVLSVSDALDDEGKVALMVRDIYGRVERVTAEPREITIVTSPQDIVQLSE